MLPLTPTPAQIAAMASRAGVRRLLLSHFRIHMDAPGRHAAALAAMRAEFAGPVGIVEDLENYAL